MLKRLGLSAAVLGRSQERLVQQVGKGPYFFCQFFAPRENKIS